MICKFGSVFLCSDYFSELNSVDIQCERLGGNFAARVSLPEPTSGDELIVDPQQTLPARKVVRPERLISRLIGMTNGSLDLLAIAGISGRSALAGVDCQSRV